MNRFTHTLALVAALFLVACQTSSLEITGRFAGSDIRQVYLERVSPLNQTIIDSVTLDREGNYAFRIEEAPLTPQLFNLVVNSERIPLLIARGDKIEVSAVGNILRNYTVANSEESKLLGKFYRPFILGAQNLKKISTRYAAEKLSEEEHKALGKEYTQEYFRIRREQLRFIITNKASLAAVYALYQRLPGDRFLVNGDNDVIYFREVADAIAERYPTSPYLEALRGDIKRMDAVAELQQKVTEAGFPDLEINNIYGQPVRLSSLEGKVVLLDFWSAQLGSSNVLNAELKDIYAKFHNARIPFEVYQVGIDTNKALWINTVQAQQLPWISVSDLEGSRSSALGIYNVQSLPANYLIDSKGEVVGKNLYGKSLEARLEELTK